MNDEPVNVTKVERATEFVELLTGHQRKLYGYIATMLGGDPAAADVLQETNVDLWARAGDYDFERPFLPWAFAFARLKVLAFRRSHARSRLVFADEVLEVIDEKCMRFAGEADRRLIALQSCLKKLNRHQSELIQQRYTRQMSVTDMAHHLSDTVQNISSRLYRIRKLLAECVNATLAAEER